ncbi:hypothetical protein NDU88_000110 [Pleurodeles waltl]|uniref:Uncharacterized protein n=1 Tax=Pleurodeles waltl TaxID=8319 RepID=A0AAV7SW07_PLEWA|nr:hypothetical protein NDU88_000110 [Pleurodeles waltl]
MCSSWGVQGAGPDPLMKQIRPWPVVVVPQSLSWRGRRVSPLVSSRGGGIHLGPLQSPPLIRRCSSELPKPGWRGGEIRRPIGGRGGGAPRMELKQNMGLSPSRGGPLPLPRTHLSSRPQGRVQPDRAGKMAATAPCSDPLRSSPSARPLDRAWSRQRGESGPSSGSRHRDMVKGPARPVVTKETSEQVTAGDGTELTSESVAAYTVTVTLKYMAEDEKPNVCTCLNVIASSQYGFILGMPVVSTHNPSIG